MTPNRSCSAGWWSSIIYPSASNTPQEDKCCMISVVCGIRKSQIHKVRVAWQWAQTIEKARTWSGWFWSEGMRFHLDQRSKWAFMAGWWLWVIMIHASSWLSRFQMFPPQNGKRVRWCTDSFAWQSSFIITSGHTPQIATIIRYLKQTWKRTAWHSKCKESPHWQTFDIPVVKTQANREISGAWVGKGLPWQ